MIHIKPTADRADVFQFHANFIRFYRNLRAGKDQDGFEALNFGTGKEGGIIETVHTVAEEIRVIIKKHTDACRLDVLSYLEEVANQLRIDLRAEQTQGKERSQ